MPTPVTHVVSWLNGEIVITCNWTGDETAYVDFTMVCGGVQLWNGAVSAHAPNDWVQSTVTSSNASIDQPIMSLDLLNDAGFSLTFNGTITYQNYPINLINTRVTQFNFAEASVAESLAAREAGGNAS